MDAPAFSAPPQPQLRPRVAPNTILPWAVITPLSRFSVPPASLQATPVVKATLPAFPQSPANLQATPVVPSTTQSQFSPLPPPSFISQTPLPPSSSLEALPVLPVQERVASCVVTILGQEREVAVGTILVSGSGTTREVLEITGDTIVFKITKKFEGEECAQFHTGDNVPLTWEHLQNVKKHDRFYPVGATWPEFYVTETHTVDDRVVWVTMTYTHPEPRKQDFSYVSSVIKKTLPFQKHINGTGAVTPDTTAQTPAYKSLEGRLENNIKK